MKKRIGFVIEQALGHVAYGMGLREALSARADVECVWMEVPFGVGRFGRIPVLGRNWTLRGSMRARRAIAAGDRQQAFDALVIHTQTVGVFSAGHMARIPTLLSLDATPANYDELAAVYGDRVHPGPVEAVKRSIHRSVMRRAKGFTTWSEWAKSSLVRDYGVDGEAVSVIHPGTVISKFPNPESRAARRPGPLRVLFVGGDFVRKGGDLLIDVWRQSLREQIELHLVTGAAVENEANLHVYRGLKPYSPELLALYADVDVFVLPTRADCLAMVLGEAMAASLPIITTRVGAHAEAVRDGRSGFLIAKDDGIALAERLRRFVAEPNLSREMGSQSRSVGEEHFDMHKNANRIADLVLAMTD